MGETLLLEVCFETKFSLAGMGETTSSFSWFHKEPKTFVTGMNGKILRIYDIRGKATFLNLTYGLNVKSSNSASKDAFLNDCLEVEEIQGSSWTW